MAWLIYDEVKLFGICFVLGMILAFIYDLFRIFRMLIRHSDFLVDLEDLIYWLITAWMVFQTLFQYNQGALRGYAFLGMFLGVLFYALTISRILLFIVRKVLPLWDKVKGRIKGPFSKCYMMARKTLKNKVLEVKMAIKGR